MSAGGGKAAMRVCCFIFENNNNNTKRTQDRIRQGSRERIVEARQLGGYIA